MSADTIGSADLPKKVRCSKQMSKQSMALRFAIALVMLGSVSPVFAQTPGDPPYPSPIFGGNIDIPENPEISRRDAQQSITAHKAFELLKKGEVSEAKRLFESLPKKSSEGVGGYIRAREGLGDIYASQGLWEKAAKEYEARFTFEPGFSAGSSSDKEMRAKLALALTNVGRLDEAKENYLLAWDLLKKGLRADSSFTNFPLPSTVLSTTGELKSKMHLLLLAIYLRAHRWEDARLQAQLLDKPSEEYPLTLLYRGIALSESADNDKKQMAKQDLESLLALTEDTQIRNEAKKQLEILSKWL
jgi:tetratricopeptide (TPR) repeat protein